MKWILAILFSLIFFNGKTQYYTVRGVIKDSTGAAVPYVTIEQADYYGVGTTSRADGSFSITVQNGKTIQSSCIGYSGFQYKVHSDATLEIVMPAEPLRYSMRGHSQPETKRGRVLFEIESHSYIIPPERVIEFRTQEIKVEDDNWIFSKVEVFPQYEGGVDAFLRRLAKDVKGVKRKGNIQLKFFIGPSGHISNVEILKSHHKKTGRQIVFNLNKLTWKPAMQNGRNIGVWYIFDLEVSRYNGKMVLR